MCERAHDAPAFNVTAFLQGQVALVISTGLASPVEARAAVEAMAEADAFWRLVGPMLDVAEQAVPGMVVQLEQLDGAAQQRKRGQA